MPNHFHLVLAANAEGQISRFMALLTSTHSKRWHAYQGSTGSGPVYQGRFKAFPVQTEVYFYNVCRYVEGNALRAGLVTRAEHWPWSSARSDGQSSQVSLQPWPVPKPEDWIELVNRQLPSVSTLVRNAIKKGTPLGDPAWVHHVSTSEVKDL
jgi:putative transposase